MDSVKFSVLGQVFFWIKVWVSPVVMGDSPTMTVRSHGASRQVGVGREVGGRLVMDGSSQWS